MIFILSAYTTISPPPLLPGRRPNPNPINRYRFFLFFLLKRKNRKIALKAAEAGDICKSTTGSLPSLSISAFAFYFSLYIYIITLFLI